MSASTVARRTRRVVEKIVTGGSLRLERTDRNVVAIRIPQRELLRSRARVHMRFLLERGGEFAGPRQCLVEIVDAKEQEQAVARLRRIGARQGRMIVGA